jgi:tetratricopeptide (TPR) repeat protein
LLIADFVLGSAKNQAGQYADAVSLHSPVAIGGPQVCGIDLSLSALQDLISEADSAKRPDDAERWFKEYAIAHEPAAYEWDAEGDRRSTAKDFTGAAHAYEKAASTSDYFSYDYCYAAADRFLEPVTDGDAVLKDGGGCIEGSVKQTGKQNDHYFTSELPFVYQDMASVLEVRGVYPKALEYIKESVAANPNGAFALNIEAKIFDDLEQYPECIAAAQAAIAASDGKYPSMQFELGSCSFATQNWTQAAASFRIAAESDNTDAVSAFNLGLSLSRQGFSVDALHWFREALNRNPDAELRAKILNALQ